MRRGRVQEEEEEEEEAEAEEGVPFLRTRVHSTKSSRISGDVDRVF